MTIVKKKNTQHHDNIDWINNTEQSGFIFLRITKLAPQTWYLTEEQVKFASIINLKLTIHARQLF